MQFRKKFGFVQQWLVWQKPWKCYIDKSKNIHPVSGQQLAIIWNSKGPQLLHYAV